MAYKFPSDPAAKSKIAALIFLLAVSFDTSGTSLTKDAFCRSVGDLTYRAVNGVRKQTVDSSLLSIYSAMIEHRNGGVLENDTEVFFLGYSIGAAYVAAKALPEVSPERYRRDYINRCLTGKTF